MTSLAAGRAISMKPPVGKYELWWRCLRKLPYSRKNAAIAVNSRNTLRKPDEREYVSYRCDHCGQYHVGHARKGGV